MICVRTSPCAQPSGRAAVFECAPSRMAFPSRQFSESKRSDEQLHCSIVLLCQVHFIKGRAYLKLIQYSSSVCYYDFSTVVRVWLVHFYFIYFFFARHFKRFAVQLLALQMAVGYRC